MVKHTIATPAASRAEVVVVVVVGTTKLGGCCHSRQMRGRVTGRGAERAVVHWQR